MLLYYTMNNAVRYSVSNIWVEGMFILALIFDKMFVFFVLKMRVTHFRYTRPQPLIIIFLTSYL